MSNTPTLSLPHGVQKNIAFSALCWVGLLEDGCTVLKYPNDGDKDTLQALRDEAARYERIQLHKHLVRYKGSCEDGILLEFCERGDLRNFLTYNSLSISEKIKISKQVTGGLAHLHQQNFIHCDIHARNVFLTSAMDAKIGDLQGQLNRPDGSIEWETMSQEDVRHRHPEARDDEFSPRTDLFALGTLLYHIWHGQVPFPQLDEFEHEEEIRSKFRQAEYPISEPVRGIDRIILKCWASEYEQVQEVSRDLNSLFEDEQIPNQSQIKS